MAVLSPHPDDAVLSCWHVLSDPGDVIVVNVFTGVGGGVPASRLAWWDRLTGASSASDRMRDRLAEDAEALGLTGREAVNLGFLDGQYRPGDQPVEALADRLAAVLDPATVLYAPAALGAIADHDVVRAAAIELGRRGYEVAFYADLPHAIRFGWPASVTAEPGDPAVDVDAYWEAILSRALPQPRAFAVEVHELDARAQAQKLAAVRAYRTQLPGLIALNPRLAEPATFRYETTWRRSPASSPMAAVARPSSQDGSDRGAGLR
jgi:LmbE family N-acetylglucosaminyl deacetylase